MVGHEHVETFSIMNSMTHPGKPILVSSIGGSVTTMNRLSPGFRVYDLDAETLLPVNLYTYYLDLDEANKPGASPEWKLLHDFKETYEMADMRPANFRDLAERIRTDEDWYSLYIRNQSRQSPYRPFVDNQISAYCKLATGESHEKHECIKTKGETFSAFGIDYEIFDSKGNFNKKGLVDKVIGNWVEYEIDGSQ